MTDLIPMEFYLGQNYPNPFKERTVIKFCVAYKTRVKLTVYNSTGEIIQKLLDEVREPGTYETEFSMASRTEQLLDGEYMYSLETGEYKSEKRMVLLR